MPERQTQDVEFSPGIRQDVDPVRAPRGFLTEAQNVRFGRQGAIRPRRGTKTISPDTDPDTLPIQGSTELVGVLGQTGGLGVLGIAGKLYARDRTVSRLAYLGRYAAFRPVRQWPVPWQAGVANGTSKYGVAVSSTGYVGVVTSVNLVTPTLEFWIFSPDGTPVFTLAGEAASKVQLLALGSTFYLIWQFGTTITARTYIQSAPSTFTFGGSGTAGTLTSASAYWDTCAAANGTEWFLVFQNGAATIRVDRFGTVTSLANQTQAVTGTVPVSVSADASNVWIGWHNDPTVTGAVNYRALNTTLSAFSAAAVTIASSTTYGPPLIGSMPTGTNKLVVFRRSLGSTSPHTVATGRATISTSAVVQAVGWLWHAVPITKPLLGRAWCWTGCRATNWGTERALLVNLEEDIGTPSSPGKTFPELSGPQHVKRSDLTTLPSALPDFFSAVATAAGSYLVALPVILATDGDEDLIQLGLYEYQSTVQSPYRQLASLGRSGVLTGQPQHVPSRGVRRVADTSFSRLAEVGFVYPPAVLAHAEALSGFLDVAGVYSWLFTFESSDGAFDRHRSGVSAAFTINGLGGANQGVNFTLTHPDITHRDSVKLVVYRTVNGGTTFLRESFLSSSSLEYSASTGVIAYNSGGNSLHADDVISDNEEIYTGSGRKSNALAPACIFSCVSEDRLWLGGLWDGTLLQASKIRVPGEPVQFTDHNSFKVVLPETCTGLAYIDGAVIAFAQRAVYAITGDGPNDAGIGAWSQPRAICRDIGCVDYRAIVETAQGVLFKGERGFYLLPRGLGQPVFIGAAVQRYTSVTGSGYTTVLGAAVAVDSETREVVFLVSTGSAEMLLRYDLDIAAADPLMGWHRDTFSQRLAAVGSWPDGLALAKRDLSSATHALYLEESTPTHKIDASDTEAITTVVETAELRPAGLVGWWHCTTVGIATSNSDGGSLTATVTTDSDSAGAATNVTAPTAWTMPVSPSYQYRFVVPQQPQCTGVKVRLSCVRSTAVLGPTFHGLTIEQGALGIRRSQDETER